MTTASVPLPALATSRPVPGPVNSTVSCCALLRRNLFTVWSKLDASRRTFYRAPGRRSGHTGGGGKEAGGRAPFPRDILRRNAWSRRRGNGDRCLEHEMIAVLYMLRQATARWDEGFTSQAKYLSAHPRACSQTTTGPAKSTRSAQQRPRATCASMPTRWARTTAQTSWAATCGRCRAISICATRMQSLGIANSNREQILYLFQVWLSLRSGASRTARGLELWSSQ